MSQNKKTNMTEGGVIVLLNQIKERWPQFPITKENLLRPTKDLVFTFYSNFINEYYDKISYLTRCPASDEMSTVDLTLEERLFQQLFRLLVRIHIQGLTFTLLDIYEPTQKRTKNFFTVCIHFITFIDYLMNESDSLGNELFEIKDETNKYLTELHDLLQETNENAKTKAEITEFMNNILEREYKSVKNAHKEMMDLKAAKEKLYFEKKRQIESLKKELENEEYEVNCLQAKEKALIEQRVIENEYQNIIHTLKTLKTESEMLESDDLNIEDGLVLENEVLVHSAECKRILSEYDFNLHNVKELINKEAELKVISNTIEKLQSDQFNAKRQKLENDENLVRTKELFKNSQSDYKEVKESYTALLDRFSRELTKARNETQEKCHNTIATITTYNEAILKSEQDLKKLREAFIREYIRISQAEKTVLDRFKQAVTKLETSD